MIITTLSFDGTHLIERCSECGAQTSIDSRAGRGIQLLKHDAFVLDHELCAELAHPPARNRSGGSGSLSEPAVTAGAGASPSADAGAVRS